MVVFADLERRASEARRAGDLDEALRCYLDLLETNPESAAAHYNAANIFRLLGQTEKALSFYDAALERTPTWPVVRFNRAVSLLQAGQWIEGFKEYEWRKACPGFDDPRYHLARQWRGEEVNGKTVFVYPEFYQGDLIQFCRYALLLERCGATVILAAPVAMHAMLSSMSSTLILIPDDAAPPAYDYACALMSLPVAFGTTPDTAPSGRYLHPDTPLIAKWRDRIGENGLKIGVVWQGSVRMPDRFFPLRELVAQLGKVPGARLISLQKGDGLDQLEGLPEVETLGNDFDTGPDLFLDTAAAMACCDLIITADTSTAHLAGAIGLKTWIALHQPADWRWLEERTDTPWYPTARLFRQKRRGDWASLFGEMAQAIGFAC